VDLWSPSKHPYLSVKDFDDNSPGAPMRKPFPGTFGDKAFPETGGYARST